MKRDQILETAERLFYEAGFHATGIDRVTAEAGVARMTLYNHFASKDELVLAILERRHQAYWSLLTLAVERARARGERPILAVFDAHAQWLLEHGVHGCLFMRAIGEYAGHSERIAEAAAGYKRRLLDYLRELVQGEATPVDETIPEKLAIIMEGATALAQVLPPSEVSKHARAEAELVLSNDAS